MTEPLQPDAIQRLRDALLNENKAAQQEPTPMFGWCHPDDYERYSEFIADYFMSPTDNWKKSLLDDLAIYASSTQRCMQCLQKITKCKCEPPTHA